MITTRLKAVALSAWRLGRRAAPAAEGPCSFAVRGAMLSHVGLVRSNNEDAVAYVLPPPGDPAAVRGALALVADGMGGHAAGEVASHLAAETILRLFYQLDGAVPQVLARCLEAANTSIRERARESPELTGMGTTCTMLAFRNDTVFLGHIGDSRAYRVRDGALRQISEDHSLVAKLVRDGVMTEAEAQASPDHNVILRALGTSDRLEPMIWPAGEKLRDGDAFVLCSDGLSDLVNAAAIARAAALPPLQACETLLQAALQAGAHDNVSVGVFTVAAPAAAAGESPPTRRVTLRPAADDPP